jgi:hypothetical protein
VLSKERLLHPATIIAVIALLVALSGAGYAATTVGTSQLKNNAVTTPKIKNTAVTTAKLKNNAVTVAKIASNAVGAGKIANAAVTTPKIAAGAVTASQLAPATLAALQGRTGPPGPQGQPGPPGASGATSVVVRTATDTINTTGTFTTTAACQAGEVATGGGAESSGPGFAHGGLPNGPVPATAGLVPRGWQGTSEVQIAGPIVFTVWVVCAAP